MPYRGGKQVVMLRFGFQRVSKAVHGFRYALELGYFDELGIHNIPFVRFALTGRFFKVIHCRPDQRHLESGFRGGAELPDDGCVICKMDLFGTSCCAKQNGHLRVGGYIDSGYYYPAYPPPYSQTTIVTSPPRITINNNYYGGPSSVLGAGYDQDTRGVDLDATPLKKPRTYLPFLARELQLGTDCTKSCPPISDSPPQPLQPPPTAPGHGHSHRAVGRTRNRRRTALLRP